MLGEEPFPLAEVPLQEIVEKAARGALSAKPVRVFEFEQIVEAHRMLDPGEAGGKLVVEIA
ncbi:MAG TPA: zinc-binding dehydrogenase [Solirubrobacteraceae bacterium]|nr:zinc-binding dehydrogenase [Solirubrobacteraceae bacterium]